MCTEFFFQHAILSMKERKNKRDVYIYTKILLIRCVFYKKRALLNEIYYNRQMIWNIWSLLPVTVAAATAAAYFAYTNFYCLFIINCFCISNFHSVYVSVKFNVLEQKRWQKIGLWLSWNCFWKYVFSEYYWSYLTDCIQSTVRQLFFLIQKFNWPIHVDVGQ